MKIAHKINPLGTYIDDIQLKTYHHVLHNILFYVGKRSESQQQAKTVTRLSR